LDNRIGPKFLHAGPGYGGSCFPKDTLALIRTAQEAGAPLKLVETVTAVNDARKKSMVTRIVSALDGEVAGKTIAVLGLSFKPNTDDMREAPSLDIIPGLTGLGAHIRAHDPQSMTAAQPLLGDIEYCTDPYTCAAGADALVIVTEWDSYRALDLDRLHRSLNQPVVIDLRNIYRL
ncbi:MAG: UDP-glucose/GDP-mannose dehydrogenase family protein, partial [Gammaproteobacteria bacterium]|nr:UDP-glucose/GDP-mannose dehydrogenase family protein [Gammaproteobacteria bacterium]